MEKIKTIEEVIAQLQEIAQKHPGIESFTLDDLNGECAVYGVEYKPSDSHNKERVVIG